jgi:PKD repeat protein
VEPSTGEVVWLPTAAGTFPACVSATNASGQDSYAFTIQVDTTAAGPEPAAAFTLSPASGPSPLDVLLDASGSAVSAAPASYLWDFGDLSVLGTGVQPEHRYLLSGSYQVELLVQDGYGRSAAHKAPVRVTGPTGAAPPTAAITASVLSGDGTAEVAFSCDCRPGDGALAAYAWELGDQGRSFDPAVTATFPPGRHRVRLTVVDRNGLTGHDSVEVVVARSGSQPPRCRLGLKPPAGPAPLTVEHRASYGGQEGPIVSAVLAFADGSTAPGAEVTRTYDAPGRYPVTLRVQDEQGLTCADPVWVTVTGQGGAVPPRIISLATPVATCGVPYLYSAAGTPEAVGQGPFTWELVPVGGALPEGMGLDAATGEITWTPSSRSVGTQRVALRVISPAGADQQDLAIEVQCGERPLLNAGCACGTTSGMSMALAGLLLLALRAARLRSGPGSARSAAAARRSPRS